MRWIKLNLRWQFRTLVGLTMALLVANAVDELHVHGQSVTPPFPDYLPLAPFGEWVKWEHLERDVRVLINAPSRKAEGTAKTTRTLVLYATPNGNSIEQTFGCRSAQKSTESTSNGSLANAPAQKVDTTWQHDIQHVAAQMRALRELDAKREWIFAIVQPKELSWPSFRSKHQDANAFIKSMVDSLKKGVDAQEVILTGHSGGGSMIWGYLNSVDAIPDDVKRIAFLDANYSFSNEEHHGEKLIQWLQTKRTNQLVVVAYDDREITLNGKKVVGPTGGTFRATERMIDRLKEEGAISERSKGSFREYLGFEEKLHFVVHQNPENKILHTALVGEMNGLLHSLTVGTEFEGKWGTWGGPRAYDRWISSLPLAEPISNRAILIPSSTSVGVDPLKIPPRPQGASSGTTFVKTIANQGRQERELEVQKEIAHGNVPDFLRQWKGIQVTCRTKESQSIHAVYFVTPDYLSIGNNEDFFRIPMTMTTALSLADSLHGCLITRKVSDDLHAASELRLQPEPMTQQRESVATFFDHHQRIEKAFGNHQHGTLVTGIKKDVVLSNRLFEKPNKVAIYGWHYPDGRPIQPLYAGHVDWYVDYSHGIRLMANQMMVNDTIRNVVEVLADPELCSLLSDEGPIDLSAIRRIFMP